MDYKISKSEQTTQGYNRPGSTERAIEVTLGRRFYAEHKPDIELGAVMPYYHNTGDTRIIDKTDRQGEKLDASTLDYTGLSVLSISTIEHFWENGGSHQTAQDFLTRLFHESRTLLLTFPIGWDKELEKFVFGEHFPFFAYYWDKEWIYCDDTNPTKYTVFDFKYNSPKPFGNAIVCIHKNCS